MWRLLYGFIFLLTLPAIFLRWWWRGRREPAYRLAWRQRLGGAPISPAGRPVVWLHAVSVGESLAAIPLIEAWQRRWPGWHWLVTSTTPTGAAIVRERLTDTVTQAYFPLDLPFCWRRFYKRVQPQCALIMETELWPNCLALCQKKGLPVYLLNGRLSARAALRYQKPFVRGLMQPAIQSLAGIAAQTESDAEQFVAVGASPVQVAVCGNLKQALLPLASQVLLGTQIRENLGLMQRFIWVAASTHPGEETVMLAAHRLLLEHHPDALLILAPRHLNRLSAVKKELSAEGAWTSWQACRESNAALTAPVLLWDSLGELNVAYAMADAVCVAGSFADIGGHNCLEPAAHRLPIVVGPCVFKILDLVKSMEAEGALQRVIDAATLADQLNQWAESPAVCRQAGEAAYAIFQRGVQVTRHYLNWLTTQLGDRLEG